MSNKLVIFSGILTGGVIGSAVSVYDGIAPLSSLIVIVCVGLCGICVGYCVRG